MNHEPITAALVDAVNSSTRPPALYPVAYLKYPRRELRPTVTPNGTLLYCLAYWGWEYKHRGPRKPPEYVNPSAIQTALNSALPDGYTVTAVEDHKTHVQILIGGIK